MAAPCGRDNGIAHRSQDRRGKALSTTEIVIHAGMPKTGSSAIQTWLTGNAKLLDRHGITPVVARPLGEGASVRVSPWRGLRAVESSGLLTVGRPDRLAVTEELLSHLDRLAQKHGRVLLTSEGLAYLFAQPAPRVLASFELLASRHRVRVAYYVRPQHSALEAAWRQWGFRLGSPPSRYIDALAQSLHYLQTLRMVSEAAPQIDFLMRPFRRDLLIGNSVVKDFANQVLGIDPGEVTGDPVTNVGISLVVANLLAAAPDGLLWRSPHDNREMIALKRILDGLTLRDERAERGRRVLQRWAHRRWGDENDELASNLGWGPEPWVPDAEAESDDLDTLDNLWTPAASHAELAVVHRLMERAVGRRASLYRLHEKFETGSGRWGRIVQAVRR